MNIPFSRTFSRSLFLASAGWLGLALTCHAVHPRELLFDSYADFADGTARSVTLSDQGVLAPAPPLTPLAAPADGQAEQIWALLSIGSDFLAATSPQGQLLRISADGKVESAAKFKETHLYALAKNAKGEVFVGTSPDGKIYALGAEGRQPPKVWFDPKAKYIWALAFDKQGNLYAATGTEGKIFKITGEGKGEVFYASDEVHIRSLQFDPAGNLLAGSAENGLLYRIAPDGTAVVLAASGRQEVNRIVLGPSQSNSVYFTATGPAAQANGEAKASDATSALKAALLSIAQNGAKAAAAPLGGGGNGPSVSQVWRLDASLDPQLLWSTSESILTLDPDPDGGVRVGTGGDGYLYRVDDRGHATRLLKLDGPSITATADGGTDGAFVLASSNPPQLYRLGRPGERREAGVYESPVIDSKGFAHWGSLRGEGSGSFRFETRSGNTPLPDKSWYPWTALRDDHAQSPEARYFQFRIELSTGTVDRVLFAYLPKNTAPKVDEIYILAPGVGYVSAPPAAQAAQAKTSDQLLQAAENGGDDHPAPATRYQPLEARGYRTAIWKAEDAEDDDLVYDLYFRSENEKEWHLLSKDDTETVFSWDSSGWPDGRYYLKVTASDAPDNLPTGGLSDELVSRLFVVDNTPPVIAVSSGRSHDVKFTVSDEASGIGSVSISRDGNDFKELHPADGVLDPRKENFATRIDPGDLLFIRAEDQSGNVSSTQINPDAK